MARLSIVKTEAPEDLEKRGDLKSTEAEQALLGGLLLDNTAFERVADLVRAEDFFHVEHRTIFEVLSRLISAARPADVVTVFEELQALQESESVGGLAYINALAQSVPSAANARQYADIVRGRSNLRKLATFAQDLQLKIRSGGQRSFSEIVEKAESDLVRISDESFAGLLSTSFQDHLIGLLDRVNELHDNGAEEVTGVATGFFDLDALTTGFHSGEVSVLVASTLRLALSFALNISARVALQQGIPVAVYSTSSSAREVAAQIVGAQSRISQRELKLGRLREQEWGQLAEVIDRLRDAPIHIEESANLSPVGLRMSLRRIARQYGRLGLVVVEDALGKIGSTPAQSFDLGAMQARNVELARTLQQVANELQTPVLLIIDREDGSDDSPSGQDTSNVFGISVAVRREADIALSLRSIELNADLDNRAGIAELTVTHRGFGPTGTVRLLHDQAVGRFENLAVAEEVDDASQQPSQAYKALFEKAVEVLGSRSAAERWLSTPALPLGSDRPIDLANSPGGVERALRFLEQLKYGVYP